MCGTVCLITFTVVVAIAFDLVNGFHDAANSIATVVSTKVLRPGAAVLWAAFFNFVAMFVFHPRVAETVSQIVKIQPHDTAFVYVVLTGLLGAIAWDLFTWWFGLPTSSSHALIGGFAGAGVAYQGWQVIDWGKINIIYFIFIAPMMGFAIGMSLMLAIFWLFRRWTPASIDALFRKGQLLSAALYSLGHGANDAQKTMGIIMALMFAAGIFGTDVELSLTNPQTLWIILSCQAALALGTSIGGWRIVKTMGMRITKLRPVGGFCAETAGAITLFLATRFGIPVSTTHTITGSIMGVGTLGTKFSSVKWGVATKIFWAWLLTIPAAGILSALLFHLIHYVLLRFD